MINLASDLIQKLDASGFSTSEVCERADVSPSTVTLMRRRGNCSQRSYDKMLTTIIEMARERKAAMENAGLYLGAEVVPVEPDQDEQAVSAEGGATDEREEDANDQLSE